MLKFKEGNFIDETVLELEEARIFVAFLEGELERHRIHLAKYQKIATSECACDFKRIIAQTVVIRNIDDIEHTKKTLNYLYKKYDV